MWDQINILFTLLIEAAFMSSETVPMSDQVIMVEA